MTALAGPGGAPVKVGIKPDRKRASPFQRGVVTGPVRRAVAWGRRLRHAGEHNALNHRNESILADCATSPPLINHFTALATPTTTRFA